ncbi:Uma2 family endonuclease [Caulobacter sp. Root343]|jgi:Uma2 family endonuclease|uniref:Uma2 family endonuclease n=1 Tax=Caulobacter sp. Root343 TaxID=1736520 RepID=UPI0006FB20E2|nr:Uma2 family endonuclease [Caulobacter sp. Root343]KQV64069.1 hypothetical protein ASC70_19800 [Caulobacter sp. Root343]
MNTLLRALETAKPHRFTLQDLQAMTQAGILGDERLELIDGVPVTMPVEGPEHGRLRMRLVKGLYQQANDQVQLVVGAHLTLGPGTAAYPDIFLYDAALALESLDGRAVGLVIEVADATLSRDLGFKADLYAQQGVREYWLVNARNPSVTVHHGLDDGAYRDVVEHLAVDTIVSRYLSGVTLCLRDLPTIR